MNARSLEMEKCNILVVEGPASDVKPQSGLKYNAKVPIWDTTLHSGHFPRLLYMVNYSKYTPQGRPCLCIAILSVPFGVVSPKGEYFIDILSPVLCP